MHYVNYPALASPVRLCRSRRVGWASVLIGECLRLDFRPSFGLTSPPTAETAEPSAFSILIPSALILVAAFPSRSCECRSVDKSTHEHLVADLPFDRNN